MAEPQPILFKDSARRAKYKIKYKVFIFIAEPQPILLKDSARRVKYKM